MTMRSKSQSSLRRSIIFDHIFEMLHSSQKTDQFTRDIARDSGRLTFIFVMKRRTYIELSSTRMWKIIIALGELTSPTTYILFNLLFTWFFVSQWTVYPDYYCKIIQQLFYYPFKTIRCMIFNCTETDSGANASCIIL